MDADEEHRTVEHALVGHPPPSAGPPTSQHPSTPYPSTPPSWPAPRGPGRALVGQGAKAAVGAFGEQLVADRLVEQGWTVLERNWRSRSRECPGELDIITLDPDGALVVVEVRTRRGDSHGTALESVTPLKLRRLRRLFGVWCRAQEDTGRVRHTGGPRIDVVAVQLRRQGPSRLTHVRGVG